MAVAATPPDESGRAQAIDGTFTLIDADCRPIFHNFVLRILLASTSANGQTRPCSSMHIATLENECGPSTQRPQASSSAIRVIQRGAKPPNNRSKCFLPYTSIARATWSV